MKVTEVEVRGNLMKLITNNRSLELCARMNYETENLDFIDQIHPKDIFLDLGACEGRFSIYAGLKGIRTFSFEPEKRNFETLQENIVINNLESVVNEFNLAVGEASKDGILSVGQPWAGGHQKIVQHDSIRSDVSSFEQRETQDIKLIDLDTFVKKIEIIPSYMKIDIDGSEIPFINGAKKTLRSTELKGILFELDINDPNYTFVVDSLNKFGFSIFDSFQIPNEPSLKNVWFQRTK